MSETSRRSRNSSESSYQSSCCSSCCSASESDSEKEDAKVVKKKTAKETSSPISTEPFFEDLMMSDSEDSPSSPVAQTSEVKPPLDFAALKKLIEDAEVAAGSSDKKRKVEAVSETAKKKKIESSVIPQTVKIVTKPKVNKPLLNKKARKQLEGAQKSLDQIFTSLKEFYAD